MFLFPLFYFLVTIRGESNVNVFDTQLIRSMRQANQPSTYYALPNTNEHGEQVATLVLERVYNLTTEYGTGDRCGVCSRKYRVLSDIKYNPSEECRRYSSSSQASLGDLTEFYHTLYNNHWQAETMTFPLRDRFPDLRLTASFMPSAINNGPPHLMIESATGVVEQVLCVETIYCPKPVTKTTMMTTSTTTPKPSTSSASTVEQTQSVVPLAMAASHEAPRKPADFWESLMASSNPRSWVISTIVLAAMCFILVLALFGTCIWICRVKRHYRRKHCRGVCRFGCKCSAEAIRQAAADAAVYGPLSNNHSSAGGGIGNGSLLTYPSVGRSWGLSNGANKPPFNPLYVSLAPNDKLLAAQGSATPPSQQAMFSGMQGATPNWPQYQMSMQKGKRVGPDNIWRSHSDGSSLSEHTVPSGLGSGPTALRSHPSRSSGPAPAGLLSGYNANASTASTCMQSYVGMGAQGETESNPGLMHAGSPVRFDEFQREQAGMIGSVSGNGGYDQNGMVGQPVDLRGMNGDMFSHNLDNIDSYVQSGELANITPPAGFFDMNGGIVQPNNNSNTIANNHADLPPKLTSLDQSWTYSAPPPTFNSSNAAIKSFTSDLLKTTAASTPPIDYKRRNGGYLNGVAEEQTVKRSGLSTNILSFPVPEGVEQSYSFEPNSDTRLRSWNESLPS